MQKNKINCKKIINHWIKSSQHDFETAEFLFKGKRYSECLFFCHLTIEKLLKGLVVKQIQKSAPFTHDLFYLSKLAELNLTSEQKKYLEEITKFNISARYDNAKLAFYETCTKSYAEKYLKISNDLYLWLRKLYQKK